MKPKEKVEDIYQLETSKKIELYKNHLRPPLTEMSLQRRRYGLAQNGGMSAIPATPPHTGETICIHPRQNKAILVDQTLQPPTPSSWCLTNATLLSTVVYAYTALEYELLKRKIRKREKTRGSHSSCAPTYRTIECTSSD